MILESKYVIIYYDLIGFARRWDWINDQVKLVPFFFLFLANVKWSSYRDRDCEQLVVKKEKEKLQLIAIIGYETEEDIPYCSVMIARNLEISEHLRQMAP